MLPPCLCLILVVQVITFFLALAKAQCSDSITNYTISYLAATLPAVRCVDRRALAGNP